MFGWKTKMHFLLKGRQHAKEWHKSWDCHERFALSQRGMQVQIMTNFVTVHTKCLFVFIPCFVCPLGFRIIATQLKSGLHVIASSLKVVFSILGKLATTELFECLGLCVRQSRIVLLTHATNDHESAVRTSEITSFGWRASTCRG